MLLKIQNMMDMKEVLPSLVYKCFEKKTSGGIVKMRIFQTKNYPKNYTNEFLEILRNEKYTYLL